jgi:TPR repeat protein
MRAAECPSTCAPLSLCSLSAAQRAALASWTTRPLAAIREGAECGDLAAMVAMGEILLRGLFGVTRSVAQAAVWSRRAAAGNVALGQANFGKFLEDGAGGIAKDKAAAVRLFRLGAAQGEPQALHNLGVAHFVGRGGLPRNLAEAKRCWRLAAAQGHYPSTSALSTCDETWASDGLA